MRIDVYANYEFYSTTYKGTLTEKEYDRLSVRAKAEIDRLTYGRAAKATGTDLEAVMYAQCAVVDELSKQEQGGEIASESNDGVSRSYAAGTARSKSQRITAEAMVYLCNTNLCFAGV